jgi:hypothetical protein
MTSATLLGTRALGAVFLWLTLTLPSCAVTSVTVETATNTYVLRGTLVTPEQTFDGKLVIAGDTIACVAVTCDEPAGAMVLAIVNA